MDKKAPSYGGQAVIEGVVMRGPKYLAMSVRTPSGEIVSQVKKSPMPQEKGGLYTLPVVRGALSFWDTLSLGVEMLMKSAEIATPDEETPSKTAINISVALGAIIAVAIFVLLPTWGASLVLGAMGLSGRAITSLVELVIRVLVLVGYIVSVSRMDDIKRVLQYHGAEHKVIWAWEKNCTGAALSKESWVHSEAVHALASGGKGTSRLHPRCGTSFLFLVALCSWVVFLFVSPGAFYIRFLARILLLPLVAGISYEVLKLSARGEGWFWSAIRAPGMALQALTTKDPDDDQLEVAAESLAHLIEAERGELKL